MVTNSSCPATGQTEILGYVPGHTPVSYHIVCTAPYTPGEVGDNITQVLSTCCNSTVQVVRDDTAETTSRCIYYCNATLYDNQRPESGNTFWKAQQCTWSSSPPQPDGNWNPYQFRCYPKGLFGMQVDNNTGSAGSTTPATSRISLGVVIMMIFGLMFL